MNSEFELFFNWLSPIPFEYWKQRYVGEINEGSVKFGSEVNTIFFYLYMWEERRISLWQSMILHCNTGISAFNIYYWYIGWEYNSSFNRALADGWTSMLCSRDGCFGIIWLWSWRFSEVYVTCRRGLF